jgi:hypothetical protein
MTVYDQNRYTRYDISGLLKHNQLEIFNREIFPFEENDKKGISLSKSPGNGIAWLKDVQFSEGIVELDIKGKDVFQQSFVGIAFHGVDKDTLDAVYFRPFNFQSSDPIRKSHAVQYISHPDYPWPVLREKYPGKYENEVFPAPDGDEWFHVKIVIKCPEVTVYVNGNNIPSLAVDKLNDRTTGKIGLFVGNNSDGDFANLQITNQEPTDIKIKIRKIN